MIGLRKFWAILSKQKTWKISTHTSLRRKGLGFYPPEMLSSSDPGFVCSCSTEPLEPTDRFVVVSLCEVSLPFPFPRSPAAVSPSSRASAVVRVGAATLGIFAGTASALLRKVTKPACLFRFSLGRLFPFFGSGVVLIVVSRVSSSSFSWPLMLFPASVAAALC